MTLLFQKFDRICYVSHIWLDLMEPKYRRKPKIYEDVRKNRLPGEW